MSAPLREDAQRELEQHALRNVRGLVDRIERDDAADRRGQWKIVAGLLVGIFVALLVLLGFMGAFRSKDSRVLTLEPRPQTQQQAPQAPR